MSWAKLTVQGDDGYFGEVTAMARYGMGVLVYTADRMYAWLPNSGQTMLQGFFVKDPADGAYKKPKTD